MKPTARPARITPLIPRALLGGALMGLANLLPGISGGTMLLATGIYPDFIEAISDLTRFRFRMRPLTVLASILAAAGLGILLFAGSLKGLVLSHRWIMYSLFIGLTLGGIPVVLRLVDQINRKLILSAILAFAAMVGLAILQINGVVGGGNSNFLTLTIAGLVGSSAMILPGLSGGYLLLLLGQYVPILTAVDHFKEALRTRDFSAALEPAFTVLLPVGIGLVLGVVLVGNALKWLLEKHASIILGVLLGLLVGSVVGLFPFQEGVPPEVGDQIKGVIVTPESLASIEEKDWLIQYFRPSTGQIAISISLIALGFILTLGVSLVGGSENKPAH